MPLPVVSYLDDSISVTMSDWDLLLIPFESHMLEILKRKLGEYIVSPKECWSESACAFQWARLDRNLVTDIFIHHLNPPRVRAQAPLEVLVMQRCKGNGLCPGGMTKSVGKEASGVLL